MYLLPLLPTAERVLRSPDEAYEEALDVGRSAGSERVSSASTSNVEVEQERSMTLAREEGIKEADIRREAA